MSKPESYSPDFPDAVISDDSKDSFQLTKLLRKSSKRSYRRQQLSVGDSSEIHVRKGKRSDDERHGKESRRMDRHDERQRHAEGRYRGERTREAYDRHERDLMRENSLSKRREERQHSPNHHRYERTVVYKSRDHSRDKERSSSTRTTDRKRNKREVSIKERPLSDSDTDGEIKPPLTKRPSVVKRVSPLSSSDDSEKDSSSSHTLKELNNSRSPEQVDNKNDKSPNEQVKSWKDIADESSESDSDSGEQSNRDDEQQQYSQLSEKYLKYSGMQSVSSSEIDDQEGEKPKDSPPVIDPSPNEEQPEQEQLDEVEEMIVEKEEEAIVYLPALMGCRSVESYEWLNRIEEGTYGVVFRAKDKKTGDVVALKKLKMEKEREGFPITSLREINMLLKSSHPNIVHVREIVVGSNMDKIYIVMDYVEHDLKSLMEVMKQPFLEGEVKTLMIQLLKAVHHMHDNWILHRDLKTSNLLLSHKGILKVADFGLAREYGSPLKRYTPIVVTLWYRCPELLLGAKEYSTAVDVWSVGCIFAELLQHKPVFTGKSEIDQLNYIFKELGTPNEDIWPGYNELPVAKKVDFAKQPLNNLRKRFPMITNSGFNLLNKFLTYDPKRRITAEEGLSHSHFGESPLPVDPSMFPTWPAKSEMAKKPNRQRSPTAPEGGAFLLNTGKDEEDGKFHLTSAQSGKAAVGPGFTLKF